MFRCIELFAWRFGLDKESGLARYAEAVVRTAAGVFRRFDDDFTRVVRKSFFILNIPSKSLEEGRDEINAGLRLGITLG